MKVTSKDISSTKVEIKVVLDKKDLAAARKKAVARLAGEMKIPGFRKGKAPLTVAEKQMSSNDIASNTLDIAVRASVPQAFQQAKKAPLIVPNVNVTKYIPDETAEFTATADILPEIKLGDYRKLKAKKQKITVSDQDITDVLNNIAKSYAEKSPVKRPAQLTDEVTIDFEGKKDGVPFAGGAAKDYKLVLGSGQFIPGFEDGVVGHEVGDRFDLPLTFPKDYHNKDLAGQKAVFNILLKQVTSVTPPKIDDAFAKKSSPFKTLKELKADIKKNLESQNNHKIDEKFKDDLVRDLVAKSTVDAPEVLIKDQLNLINEDISRNAQAQGLTLEEYLAQSGQNLESWEKEASEIAELRVKSSLCLQILARDQKISATDEEVEAKLAELRDIYQKSPEAIEHFKDPNVRQDIKNRLTVEKTLDYLVEQNTKKA